MVIFFENGRLGNQFFQLAGLGKYFPGQKLVLVGFDSLVDLCDGIHALTITKKIYKSQIVFRLAEKAVVYLSRARIISCAWESQSAEGYTITHRRGLIRNVVIVTSSFFQSDTPEFLGSKIPVIKPAFLERGRLHMSEIWQIREDRPKVFVHVRRGDYVSWPTVKHPAVLPAKWYFDAMDKISLNVVNPLFIIFTDDLPYAVELFADKNDVLISDCDEKMDFVLMSLCDHGVLSASSFSWWAGIFSLKNSRKNKSRASHIAPMYWLGHRLNEWSPIGIETNWLEYEPVWNRVVTQSIRGAAIGD
ncbi:alpha-1,2-fucosyltransferase [Pseudomonadales bacterium]|nr:alpha-1,2-fucosyltransferase [Pseudomonadales bacterium]